MRETKRRSLFSIRQLVVLEVLLLANVLIAAVFGIIVYSNSVLSHRLPPTLAGPDFAPAAQLSAIQPTLAFTPYPTWTLTPIPSPTVITSPLHTFISSNTPTSVVPGLSATPAPTSTLIGIPEPLSKILLDVQGYPQTLPLSCEARAAVDWAAYFGVSIDELEFLSRLPLSDNPDLGFVGDVRGKWGQVPPNSYGVHAEPVAALLREYGVSAEARRGLTWNDLHAELGNGRPVIVWVVGHVWSRGQPIEYTAADGTAATVAPYEHTVMVIGYADDNVIILDGRKIYWRSLHVLFESWAVLGNMAITAGQ